MSCCTKRACTQKDKYVEILSNCGVLASNAIVAVTQIVRNFFNFFKLSHN
jgi:hypothetical protein